jgi:hypothetical protein
MFPICTPYEQRREREPVLQEVERFSSKRFPSSILHLAVGSRTPGISSCREGHCFRGVLPHHGRPNPQPCRRRASPHHNSRAVTAPGPRRRRGKRRSDPGLGGRGSRVGRPPTSSAVGRAWEGESQLAVRASTSTSSPGWGDGGCARSDLRRGAERRRW